MADKIDGKVIDSLKDLKKKLQSKTSVLQFNLSKTKNKITFSYLYFDYFKFNWNNCWSSHKKCIDSFFNFWNRNCVTSISKT